ncbi:MAG TPA: glycosyltransferase family 39 protein [Pyrinomonadaceae bacterium]|nr:glycosyltransferase family 39 protein [Pyrinomonadaceae bacterium]
MTSPPLTVKAHHTSRTSSRIIPAALLLLILFLSILVLHLPLLNLPYYWDEVGYFVPAARDFLFRGDPIPINTLSNAHPPLVMIYLALCWKLFGESIFITRVAMSLVAASALLAVFCLARRVANREVAVASTLVTALYPVFFAQSSLAHLDMAAAALTIWGLFFYLPSRGTETDEDSFPSTPLPLARRRLVISIVMFGLAALAKETAILTPLALFGWELVTICWRGWKRGTAIRSGGVHANVIKALSLILSLLPLTLWLAYHYHRTGYVFGNPEFFRYNVEATLTPGRIMFAGAERIWHVTGHMNLFLLTGAAALMMLRTPLRDAGGERRRIDVHTQLVFAVLIVAHVVALSLVGGAVLARYMLPVTPLLIIVCVSTLWRRTRNWRKVIIIVCVGFVLALFVNPPRRYPWEENLAYRDFIMLHREAAQFIADNHPEARVLTAWPATDELREPYFGYTNRPLSVVTVDHFSIEHLAAARDASQFDVALIFSTNYPRDLQPDEAASLLGGRIIFREERQGQWVAIIRSDR